MQIEASGQEISDETFETYGNVLNQPDEGCFYKHYAILAEDSSSAMDIISVKETKQLVSGGTTGLRTWQVGSLFQEDSDNNTSY